MRIQRAPKNIDQAIGSPAACAGVPGSLSLRGAQKIGHFLTRRD